LCLVSRRLKGRRIIHLANFNRFFIYRDRWQLQKLLGWFFNTLQTNLILLWLLLLVILVNLFLNIICHKLTKLVFWFMLQELKKSKLFILITLISLPKQTFLVLKSYISQDEKQKDLNNDNCLLLLQLFVKEIGIKE